MKIAVFWDIAPCSLFEVDQPGDGGNTHLWNVILLQRDYGAMPQKAVVFKYCTFVLLYSTATFIMKVELWHWPCSLSQCCVLCTSV
jgi:hypothetical protein